MPKPKYDQAFWEALWAKTLREHPDKVAHRQPSSLLLSEVAQLPPGRALDAGCGHGVESLWLASQGWNVTSVDFSAAALAFARSTSVNAGSALAARTEWVKGDLAEWTPAQQSYDLVLCLYVHAPLSAETLVRQLSAAVKPAGTFLLAGHQPVDPATGEETAAAGQVQVSVEAALSVLAGPQWRVDIAEERKRTAGGGVDAVVKAVRLQ